MPDATELNGLSEVFVTSSFRDRVTVVRRHPWSEAQVSIVRAIRRDLVAIYGMLAAVFCLAWLQDDIFWGQTLMTVAVKFTIFLLALVPAHHMAVFVSGAIRR